VAATDAHNFIVRREMRDIACSRKHSIAQEVYMMNAWPRMTAGIAVFALAALGASPASARRHLAVGAPVFGSTASCLNFDHSSGNVGAALTNTTACKNFIIPPTWVMPVHLDTSGSKTVALTVRQTAANQLSCALIEYNPTGAVVEVVSYDNFTVGAYMTASKSITIASGNTLGAACSFKQSDANIGQARIMTIEY
jgi:hypothetical protein